MNTTEEKKTPREIIWDAMNCIGGAVWDLKIIENTLITANENELIVIPDRDNDPLRMALLALRAVRTELEEQEETLYDNLPAQSDEEKTHEN